MTRQQAAKKPTILCVEDESDFRENIVEFLQHESFDVIQAENAADGIKRFGESSPDIVLCDVQMPGMSGLDMLHSLKEKYPSLVEDTTFMFLSAIGDKEHMLSGYHMGCDDYIVKPVDYDLLLAKLQRQMERRVHRHTTEKQPIESVEEMLAEFVQIHMQRPLHGLLGYSELLSDATARAFPAYIGRIKGTANEQLQLVKALSTVMKLLAGQYEPSMEQLKAGALFWESAVTALGYDMAQEMISKDMGEDAVIRADAYLHHMLLDRFMRDLYRYTQKPVLHTIDVDQSALKLACFSQTFAQKTNKEWLSIDEFLHDLKGREALVFHGITVSLAMAMEPFFSEPIKFALQSESSIAMQLTLPLVEM